MCSFLSGFCWFNAVTSRSRSRLPGTERPAAFFMVATPTWTMRFSWANAQSESKQNQRNNPRVVKRCMWRYLLIGVLNTVTSRKTRLFPRFCVLYRRGQFLEPAPGEDFFEVRKQLLVDGPVTGQDLSTVKAKWRTVKAGHASAGFLNQKYARRGVPRIQVEFPEAVIAPACDVGQVERRRPSAPHAMRAQRDLVIKVDVGILVPLVAGKAGAEDRFRQLRRFGNVDWLTVQRGTQSAFCREHLVACRVVQNAGLKLLILARQRDRNAEHRIDVGKIGGAVEGIDIPAIVGAGIAAGALFADNSVFRPARAQALDDQLFRGAVGLGH